jgi:hypothetical protein
MVHIIILFLLLLEGGVTGFTSYAGHYWRNVPSLNDYVRFGVAGGITIGMRNRKTWRKHPNLVAPS